MLLLDEMGRSYFAVGSNQISFISFANNAWNRVWGRNKFRPGHCLTAHRRVQVPDSPRAVKRPQKATETHTIFGFLYSLSETRWVAPGFRILAQYFVKSRNKLRLNGVSETASYSVLREIRIEGINR